MTKPNLIKLDKFRVRASFNDAAGHYEEFDFLQREISSRVFDRLEDIVVKPTIIANLGSGTGRNSKALEKRFKRSKIVNIDLAEQMLLSAKKTTRRFFKRQYFVCGDIEHNPLCSGSVDLAFSNLALQWCPNLGRAFSEVSSMLRPGGLFIFSTLGPDTLKELREVFSTQSDFPHVSTFLDMHDVGDILSSSGFTDPVMESDVITIKYSQPIDLLRDLKGLGASNADADRRKSLTGASRMRRVLKLYDALRENGKVPATYEVIFGHAWAVKRNNVNEFPLLRV